MNKIQIKQRLLAGLVHLGASVVVASAAAALIFLVWYPTPLAQAQGISQLLLLLIAVDVTIGPLITVMVFDRRKKELKFDLAVVVVLQLSALLYGLHSIFDGRPALLVFNVDRFDAVQAANMDPEGLRLAQEKGKPGLPWFGPRLVGALLPTDPKERNALTFGAAQGGPDLPELAQYHVPYAEVTGAVKAKALPLQELKAVNELDDAAWQELLHSLPLPEAELGYLPLKARDRDCAVVVNRATGEVVRILALQPKWRLRGASQTE